MHRFTSSPGAAHLLIAATLSLGTAVAAADGFTVGEHRFESRSAFAASGARCATTPVARENLAVIERGITRRLAERGYSPAGATSTVTIPVYWHTITAPPAMAP